MSPELSSLTRVSNGRSPRGVSKIYKQSASRGGEYLIQDPYHEYGEALIDHIHREYGYRAICFYTDRRERALLGVDALRPGSARVAAAYDYIPEKCDDFIETIRSRHKVLGIVPFNETSVVLAADIAARLGLDWAQPSVMRRFRDKYGFKQHLRRLAHGIRINASILVKNRHDVLSVREHEPYRRFVLKPNNGYGNRHIRLFDPNTTDAQIDQYFTEMKGDAVVMEEYIGDTEYFVNGQMDADGSVTTVAIFEYDRQPANQRHNIDFETRRVGHGTAVFGRLESYAASIMRASGLKRCPFHLEVKIDAQGPCLIEAAARMAGHGNAILSGELHGPRMSAVALAAHYYFSKTPHVVPLDWGVYDAQSVRYVHGVADKRERVLDLDGIAEVEALPEFHSWVKKPFVGMRADRTMDTLTMPWNLILKGPGEAETEAAAKKVRNLICWNTRCGRVRRFRLILQLGLTRILKRIRRVRAGRLPVFPVAETVTPT